MENQRDLRLEPLEWPPSDLLLIGPETWIRRVLRVYTGIRKGRKVLHTARTFAGLDIICQDLITDSKNVLSDVVTRKTKRW